MRKPSLSLSTDELASSRALKLDTIASVLPMDRRDALAALLTDQDIETLRHLVNEGMGENTLRALTSDLAYLEAWSLAATVAHSLAGARSPAFEIRRASSVAAGPARDRSGSWHAGKCRAEPADARLPSCARAPCAGHGATATGHLVDTHQMARASGCLCLPCSQIRPSCGGPRDAEARKRKSAKAVTGDILSKLLATCRSDSLRDRRDRASSWWPLPPAVGVAAKSPGSEWNSCRPKSRSRSMARLPCPRSPSISVAPRPAGRQ